MHPLCVWQLLGMKGTEMTQILLPCSSRWNEGDTYTQIFQTYLPPLETEGKCSSVFWETPSLFSIPPSALAGLFPQRAVPQHWSFYTNAVFQRWVETTLWASPKLTGSYNTSVSPPCLPEEREHAHSLREILGTLFRNRLSTKRHETKASQ